MEVGPTPPGPGIAPTWAVSTGKLPNGLTLPAGPTFSSTITGTPTTAGVFTFVITAMVSTTPVNSIAYTMAVGSGLPVITPTALPTTATSGTAVPSNFYTAAATGGYPCVTSSAYCTASNPSFTPYYNWSLATPTCSPAPGQPCSVDGLSIDPKSGAITGTPLSGGTFPLTIQATDGLGQNATAWATSVTVGGAANFLIITPSLPNGTVGTAYTPTITTQGGLTPMTFSRVSGNLPPGVIDCAASGINCNFSGTPTVAGTYNFSLQASYNNGSTVNSNIQPYTVVIAQSGSTLALPAPTSQSVALSQTATMQFTATGGTGPYIYSLLFGTFPPGLNLSASTGTLTGTATATGSYTFTVEATDAGSAHASATSTIAVGSTLSLPQPASQTVTIGQAVTMQFTAAGGVAPYTYSLISGSLPSGLGPIGTSTGTITGTVSASAVAGVYNFTIQVQDSTSNIATAQSSITVNGSSSTLSLPAPSGVTVAAGQTTTQQFTATGGTSPYTYSITTATYNGGSITIPSGLTISTSTGLVTFATTGSTATGTYVVTVQAVDSGSHVANAQGSLTVGAGALGINTPSATTVISGQAMTPIQFTATGGTAPYTYTIASGALPTGVTLAGSTGAVSGTPTATGTFTYAVKATDSASGSATSGSTSIVVNAALGMASPAPVNGVNNSTLTMQFTATGGTTPYTYSITGVTLNGNTITIPSQMTINSSSGLVSFSTTTATLSGPYVVTVTAKDSASPQGTVSATGTMTVGAALTMANPPAILNGVVGQPITMPFTAVGGTPPYTYSFLTGTLPPGNPQFTVNAATGLVSGTPTAAGSYGFTIQVTDSATPTLTANAQGLIVLQNLSLIGSNIAINIPGASTGPLAPATQPQITLTIGAPLQQDIQGTLNLSFRRVDNQLSSEIQFLPNPGVNPQSINFKIPAGSTTATFGTNAFIQIKTGTAAGSGQIAATFQDLLGNNLTPPSLQPVQFSLATSAPVINCAGCGLTLSLPTAATGSTPGGTYTATIVGYSTALGISGISTVKFDFTATSGTQLSNSSVTVDVQSAFQNWFSSSASNPTGGQFKLKVPLNFSVSGGSQSNPIAGATATVTSSQGSVTSTTAVPQ